MSNQIERTMVEVEVEVVSTQLVQARNYKKQRIELAPPDLKALLLPAISWGLVFLKPQPPSHSEYETQKDGTISLTTDTYVEHLKKSLSCTLDSFFLLAGRLAMVEHDNDDDSDNHEKMVSFFVDCNNQGAQFVHAIANHVTVADILDPVSGPPILHSFFPLNMTINYDGVSNPLLAIQLTELVDGVFIGCYMNHSVADGSSFWSFINSWSEISRRQGPDQDHIVILSKPPVFDRSLFGNTCSNNFPIRVPFSSIDSELSPQAPVAGMECRVFHFSKTKIAELKGRTTSGSGGSNKISSLQSLLAHVWRFMLQNRVGVLNPADETRLVFAIGTRSRFEVPLGEEYFGNGIDTGVVTLTVEEIIDGVGYAAALQINKVVASLTPDKVTRNLESWIQNPKLLRAGNLPHNAFVVSSSPRFNVYGNDFGWGKPVGVRSKPSTDDGVWILFPGVEEGSIDIWICSSSQSLRSLGNDSHFT